MNLFEQLTQISRSHPALKKKRYSFTRPCSGDKSITSVIAYSLDEAQGKLDSNVSFRLSQIDKLNY